MQISKVKIGETYAAEMSGNEVALTVMEIVTVKSESKTQSYVNGRIPGPGETRFSKVEYVPVADLIDEVSNHQRLLDEQAKRDAERKAEAQAAKEKQWLACQLLAKAIGAQAVQERYPPYAAEGRKNWKKWDENTAAVWVDYGDVRLNKYALDNIIETFGGADAQQAADDQQQMREWNQE